MFHFFWSRHAFLVEPPHLQPPRPILPLSLSLFSFSLQFSPLVAANISPLGLVLARQPLAAIEAAMMGRQRSRKQRRSQLRSSSLIDLVRVFFSIFGRCCRVTCEGGSLSFIIFFGSRGRTSFFFQSRINEIGLASLQKKKNKKKEQCRRKKHGGVDGKIRTPRKRDGYIDRVEKPRLIIHRGGLPLGLLGFEEPATDMPQIFEATLP